VTIVMGRTSTPMVPRPCYHGRRLPVPRASRNRLLQVLTSSTLVGVAGLGYPFGAQPLAWLVAVALVAVNGWIWWRPGHWTLDVAWGALGRLWVARLLLVVLPPVIVLGSLEVLAQVATRNDWVSYRVPMVTMLPGGLEDFRLAHLTADEFREPDPVLLWRPIAAPPYNSHRFKGPEPVLPKPAGVFRIMAYGDSNTDGPDTGAWPAALQEALNVGGSGPLFEVLNAGVTGYSSLQGLRRFREQASRYAPDLVLVSFGWNDAAPAIGGPDRSFELPPPVVLGPLRLALRYRSFLTLQYYTGQLVGTDEAATESTGPRVSVDEYGEHLQAFVELAEGAGAAVVLLTRPYRFSAADLGPRAAWRLAVPDYNERLGQVARETGAPMVDVARVYADRFPGEFADEAHFTLAGHDAFGQLLAAELRRLGVVPGS